MSNPELIFPEDYRIDGFTTNVTSRQAGDPDPVIRELLQNCLDAAVREAKRDRAEVHFTIAQRPIEQLPGYQQYVDAFRAARAELPEAVTNDVRSAVRRIESTLAKPTMSVLFCRDNGIGLDAKSMQALLSEGQSHKPNAGAGSYGLGHLTAYPASDLRYVLYAGKRGQVEIASGHAILGSHKASGTRHAAHGYWRNQANIFSLEDGEFPSVAPDLLRTELDRITTSGSVVAIAGFNHFHDPPDRAIDEICRVAALNFMGAIWQGLMVVHVSDEASGQTKRVDAGSLESMLLPISKQQRAPAKGWLAGSQGYRALTTLHSGRWLSESVDRSIGVRFRSLDAGAGERSRVQVFRDGMWITNSAPRLDTGAFGGVRAFDAVVMLTDYDPDDHTEFYDLIRNSEGPEHRDLTKYRELSRADKDKLQDMLQLLADQLRSEAGKLSDSDGWSPTGFAVFDGDIQRHARAIPGVRQPSKGRKRGTSQRGGSTPGKKTSKRTHRDRTVVSAVGFQSSANPQLDANGRAIGVRGTLRIDDSEVPGSNGRTGTPRLH